MLTVAEEFIRLIFIFYAETSASPRHSTFVGDSIRFRHVISCI